MSTVDNIAYMINPSLYQINTRVWLNKLSQELGYRATLDDISDYELDQIAKTGFDWVYFLGVWQTGIMGQDISRRNLGWRKEAIELFGDDFQLPPGCSKGRIDPFEK